MATPVINYADAYQKAVAQSFYDGNLYTSDLWNSPSNALYTFIDAKHIKVPRLKILAGRKDRARRTITTVEANYSNDYDVYELTNERYWSTLVDPSDVDETQAVVSIANITRQFNLDSKMPEKDREMFSKLYAEKVKYDGADGIHTDTLTAQNILEVFDDIMQNFDEARIPAAGRILYVTPHANGLLKQAQALNRAINISDPQNVNRMVHTLDEVEIKVVPSDLMQTEYDFTTGSKLKTGAKQIEMMMISNGVQLAPEKYSFVGFDAPNAQNSGNYLYYEQSYDDVLLLAQKTKGIEFVTSTRTITDLADSSTFGGTFDKQGTDGKTQGDAGTGTESDPSKP